MTERQYAFIRRESMQEIKLYFLSQLDDEQ